MPKKQQAISLKQNEVVEAVRSRKYKKIFLIGAIGTSKTYIMALIFINIAYQYENSLIPIARTTLPDIRDNTLPVFYDALDISNMVEGEDYRVVGGQNANRISIIFPNGSIIRFIPLDHTKDRKWRKVKGMNATAAGVDEVDTVMQEGFTELASRTGRRNDNGGPEVTIATCNPNDAWFKEAVYDPWKNGTLEEDTCVIEFEMKDSWLYREGFYDKFKTNSREWQERYLRNNWDYLDDDNSLFKSKVFDAAIVDTKPEGHNFYSFAGLDVAREGKDRRVIAKIEDNTLVDIVVYDKEDLERLAKEEEKEPIKYLSILGRLFMEYCRRNDIGYEHTAVDAVGNGSGVVEFCWSEGFITDEYKAGTTKGVEDYDMLRSEVAHKMAKDMENGDFLIFSGCPYLKDLKQELMYHIQKTKDKKMHIESKQGVKDRLGKSPDIADAVFIAYWKMKYRTTGTLDNYPDDDEIDKPFTAGLESERF